MSNGFEVNEFERCVYNRFNGAIGVLICLYVDGMLIFGTDETIVMQTKSFLASHFDMKDMGETNVILGFKLTKTDNDFILSRSYYVEKFLKKFNRSNVEHVETPYDSSVALKKNKREYVSQSEYAQIIGSVMYLINCIHPDIAYAVSRLSRYIHNPDRSH